MYPERLNQLIELLGRLPGVGEKTATRHALYLAMAPHEYTEAVLATLAEVSKGIRPCERCGFLADTPEEGAEALCVLCRDSKRDPSLLCVVARPQEVLAFERSGAMRGRYYILSQLLSPLEGVGPEKLPLDKLLRRIREDSVREVILATPPTVDGEATALWLRQELRPLGVKVSRIASGVPHGGDLEYADQITLGRALEGRRVID